MNRHSRDRELLFGLVALSKEFLKAEELIEAVTDWTHDDQTQPLVNALMRRGCITQSQREIVDSVVQGESEDEWNTLLPGMLSTHAVEAVRETIHSISDDEVRTSLDNFMTIVSAEESRPPSRTAPLIPGEQFRFQIRKELARGGLGQVCMSSESLHDPGSGRDG